ncbi:hypothetical protein [Aliamphritea spongicola]|nr:hypothetical protein [Aliamphritea spongicola]
MLIIRDEETHQEIAENLLHIAYQDSLTNLPNRRLFIPVSRAPLSVRSGSYRSWRLCISI